MFKTLRVVMKPRGARATPKPASPIPSIALIMLMALVTPEAILAEAPAAASPAPPAVPPLPPPGAAKTPPPERMAPPTPKAAPEKARD